MKFSVKNVFVPALVLTVALTASAGVLRATLPGTYAAPEDSDSTKVAEVTINPASIVDEVIWVVGDEPILKSDVENMRLQAEADGMHWSGDPDCTIPEQLAVQKLFLHQAAIDSVEVTESEISTEVEQQLSFWINNTGGSREKVEEYFKKSISQLRADLHDDFRDRLLIEKMRNQLVEDIAVSPADVRQYFKELPEDSIPFVPSEVEVQISMKSPRVAIEEVNRVKDQLREYTERVTNGETSFATLARLYSEDPGSARQGGELDYTGRGMLDPAFANVAFNLSDPNKISKIVETEFGFHIIQLIDKRGDKIKCRHILLTPKVSAEAIEQASQKLDSLAIDLRNGKFTFDEAATYLSDDKDTKNNHGLMSNTANRQLTSRFRMQDLPSEVARVVDTLQVGQVSDAFQMRNSKGKTVCAIVKLKNRIDGHRATITEDFQVLRNVVLAKRREDYLREWVKDKLKNTYVRMNERYQNCQFEYEGWKK